MLKKHLKPIMLPFLCFSASVIYLASFYVLLSGNFKNYPISDLQRSRYLNKISDVNAITTHKTHDCHLIASLNELLDKLFKKIFIYTFRMINCWDLIF